MIDEVGDLSRDKHFIKKCSTFKHKSWSSSFIKKSFKNCLQCSSLATRNADAFVEILLVVSQPVRAWTAGRIYASDGSKQLIALWTGLTWSLGTAQSSLTCLRFYWVSKWNIKLTKTSVSPENTKHVDSIDDIMLVLCDTSYDHLLLHVDILTMEIVQLYLVKLYRSIANC